MSLLSWLESTNKPIGDGGETLSAIFSEQESEQPADFAQIEEPENSFIQTTETDLACLKPESPLQPFLSFP